MVRVVACETRGPWFNSSSDQMFFLSSGIRNKMDADKINSLILGIHVDKIII